MGLNEMLQIPQNVTFLGNLGQKLLKYGHFQCFWSTHSHLAHTRMVAKSTFFLLTPCTHVTKWSQHCPNLMGYMFFFDDLG